VATCEGEILTVAHAGLSCSDSPRSPLASHEVQPPADVPTQVLRRELDAVERQRISAALAACRGNRSHAAKLLGIARNTLASRIDRFGIDVTRTKAQR
jgi:DNA-binding NtrC family response regulator